MDIYSPLGYIHTGERKSNLSMTEAIRSQKNVLKWEWAKPIGQVEYSYQWDRKISCLSIRAFNVKINNSLTKRCRLTVLYKKEFISCPKVTHLTDKEAKKLKWNIGKS